MPDGVKRRPRAEWLIQRDTHEALISEHEAEAILSQVERSLLGKRTRASPLLLTGLLETDGESWHSDGCGFYRLGKGRKLMAAHVEQVVLGRLREDLMAEETVDRVRASMQAIAAGDHVDGRRIVGLERRASSLSNEISRTVGLASQIPDPAPVLRRVTDLEHQRAALLGEIEAMRRSQQEHIAAASLTVDQVRALLRRLFDEISELTADAERRAEARVMLAELLDRIELNPTSATARLHYSIKTSSAATGDKVATPRGFEPLLQP